MGFVIIFFDSGSRWSKFSVLELNKVMILFRSSTRWEVGMDSRRLSFLLEGFFDC
jgi:hypothetical protein